MNNEIEDESTSEDVARETEAIRESSKRLREERAAIEAENLALEALVRKRTKFVRQLERFLTLAQAKSGTLACERQQILSISERVG